MYTLFDVGSAVWVLCAPRMLPKSGDNVQSLQALRDNRVTFSENSTTHCNKSRSIGPRLLFELSCGRALFTRGRHTTYLLPFWCRDSFYPQPLGRQKSLKRVGDCSNAPQFLRFAVTWKQALISRFCSSALGPIRHRRDALRAGGATRRERWRLALSSRMAISLGSASKMPPLEGQRKSTGDRRAGQRGWEYDAMQIFLDPSCMRFNENANAAMCTGARLCLDGDVHVLAERDQQAHQALAGEVCKVAR